MSGATAKRDYYQVLGLSREANEKEIKDAFRCLAMKYHPDRNKEAGAEERFKEIAEAYAVLSDPEKRKGYDHAGFAGVSDYSQEDLFGGINFDDIFGGTGFDFGTRSGFGDFGLGFGHGFSAFDRLFRRQPSAPRRGENVRGEVQIPLAKVASGGEEKLHLRRQSVCSACGGNGAKSGTALHACPACKGSGKQMTAQKKGANQAEILIQQISVCPSCGGRGKIIDQACPNCQGNGQVETDETLMVNIPIGIEEGMQLRIPGHGEPSHDAAGAKGDLLVLVRSAPDQRFVRDGADLWQSITISVPDAILGTELTIPTLDAKVTVKVLPGTQPEAVLRLRGKGLPRFGGNGYGDLNLRVHLHIPEQLSRQEQSLYEQLRHMRKT